MPIFLDRHDFPGVTAYDVADAHLRDLQIEQEFGVRFLTYWFDEARGTAFCLIDAPDASTARRAHDHSHGLVAGDLIEVDLSAVEAFLGRVTDAPTAHGSEAFVGSALRTIMFTDIVDSTGLAARLGDARMVEMVRAHDALVRRSLHLCNGREVKHTGDGIMASFEDAQCAVECAKRIQHAFAAFNLGSREKMQIRIGIDAGEPVEDNNDLFGSTVQLAHRLCQIADPDTIAISSKARQLVGSGAVIHGLKRQDIKGFLAPIEFYQIPLND